MFIVMCTDKPDSLELRLATREAHIDYVAGSSEIVVGGPLLDDAEAMAGTLVMLNVANRAAAEAWAANDPYAKAGLFERVEILHWKHLIGALPPAGGA